MLIQQLSESDEENKTLVDSLQDQVKYMHVVGINSCMNFYKFKKWKNLNHYIYKYLTNKMYLGLMFKNISI